MNGGRPRLSFETRLALLALLAGLPAVLAAIVLLWIGDYPDRTRWTVAVIVAAFWLGISLSLRNKIVRPLQTVSNLLAAIREGDYSIRVRGARTGSAWGEMILELNALGRSIHDQRLGALEAAALLRSVMAEIGVAVFTFDRENRLRLVNRAGERLLAEPAQRLLGRTAEELGLAECLEGEPVRTLALAFPGAAGRWGLRVSSFREEGVPHRLLVIEDLTRALREEELDAWRRLVRVLGHELNNSLAPITSIAGSLRTLLGREPLPGDWKQDAQRGLEVISGRADALSRFMAAYTRLAKLPPPRFRLVNVPAWVGRVASLETRVSVTQAPGPAITIQGDSDQLDQLLINLVSNAAEASLETGGGVCVGWKQAGSFLEIWVEDEGPGLANTANLFVPFFTTKAGGSGIGLVLCRQIAEAHGGQITLENRGPDGGCVARLKLALHTHPLQG
jgi:nitrogen fixation/metabolism regulation signal transduction histidine kinase